MAYREMRGKLRSEEHMKDEYVWWSVVLEWTSGDVRR